MTDEQILKLVKEHFDVGGIRDDGTCSEYYGNPDAFLKFAKAMYEKGNQEGYAEGCIDTHISHKLIQST
jgi:hypothetical protein